MGKRNGVKTWLLLWFDMQYPQQTLVLKAWILDGKGLEKGLDHEGTNLYQWIDHL